MKRKLLIRDLTMRDGQQSLFATRMTQNQIDRLLPYYKNAGFYALEVWGGAVPDSVMRYLNENPWDRLKKISDAVGGASQLTALSRGRNLFGYAPYPDEIISGFCKESMANGLNIMRVFDALNDLNNVKSSIQMVQKFGGVADGAICYTVDPHFTKMERFKAAVKGKKIPDAIFTDQYFVSKAKELEGMGVAMVTLKDMAGLITPSRVASLMPKLKSALSVPVDFHTHCTPGYGLASTVMAIIHGVDIVDTNIWYFGGGSAASTIELIYLFCKKLDIDTSVDMEVVADIRKELYQIRKELADVDLDKSFPHEFDPLKDVLPAEIDACFDKAIEAAKSNKEEEMLQACHRIEEYFNFPKPNELVRKAEVPGGMYSNMVAQLRQLKSEHLLDKAMELIPRVRLDSGLPPLVTPTSQIVGSQAVSCALDDLNGKPMYTTVSNQFISMVKGEYGKTPVAIDPEFRKKITGSLEEQPYDTSKYVAPENPTLPECGGELLAADAKEFLLLQLFPNVATGYLKGVKEARYAAEKKESEVVVEKVPVQKTEAIIGRTIEAPMGGKILSVNVHPGDEVKKGDLLLVYEAMKMENDITSPFSGRIRQVFVAPGDTVVGDAHLIEFDH